MGGPSGPRPCARIAAIWNKSLGPEGPPTKTAGFIRFRARLCAAETIVAPAHPRPRVRSGFTTPF
ncbi:DUF6053 domain-containing protein [Lysobacter enzymogenes]|uniref:DUF6053 domain-containing protein n=1 Tax=Lysobacter enzymogenes TaxID=69 RepID=UPI003CCC94E5